MQRAIERLTIKVPRTFSGGTHISDFEGCPERAGIGQAQRRIGKNIPPL